MTKIKHSHMQFPTTTQTTSNTCPQLLSPRFIKYPKCQSLTPKLQRFKCQKIQAQIYFYFKTISHSSFPSHTQLVPFPLSLFNLPPCCNGIAFMSPPFSLFGFPSFPQNTQNKSSKIKTKVRYNFRANLIKTSLHSTLSLWKLHYLHHCLATPPLCLL